MMKLRVRVPVKGGKKTFPLVLPENATGAILTSSITDFLIAEGHGEW